MVWLLEKRSWFGWCDMSIYLNDVPLPQAKAILDEALIAAGLGGLLREEEIPLDETASGRILSRPIWAKISSPHYHASAMDGFAVCHDDTAGAIQTKPLSILIGKKSKICRYRRCASRGF